MLGTVKDSSGGAVAEAKVTLTNTETGVSVVRTSNSEGNYEFVSVRPGIYLVSAEREGFRLALLENLRVEVGARVRADLNLTVGAVTEEIKVVAEAQLIQTDDSQRSQVLSTVQIQQMPLNGRSYSTLALLSTGVRRSSIAAGREGSFNVNGLRSTMNNFMLDGIDNNAYATSVMGASNQIMQPPPDALEEVKVITNNASAEYGHSAGATMNVAFRSGTNQLRGAGWEFFRNTALNASTFFAPPGGQKATLEYNQFGGVLGGPIVRNKMFFFADYEGLRQTTGGVAFATLPTADQRRGIFSIDVRDPRTGAIYPAGTPLPMTAFAQKVLGGLPDPTLPGTSNNYAVQRFGRTSSNKGDGKLDYSATDRLRLFGRYSWRDVDGRGEATIPQPSGPGDGINYTRSKQVAVGATHVASERALLEVRLGWSTVEAWGGPSVLGSASALDAFGISGLPSDARISGGLPTQAIVGFSSRGRIAPSPQWQFPTTWNPKVNYTMLRGRHSVKFGYEFIHMSQEVQDINPLYGSNTFAGQFTRPLGATPNNLYNLSDFIFGLRSQYDLTNVVIANLRKDMHFPYVQDDVRVNDRPARCYGSSSRTPASLRRRRLSPWRVSSISRSNQDGMATHAA